MLVFTFSELYFLNIVAKHWSTSTVEESASEFVRAPLNLTCVFCGCQIYFKVFVHGEGYIWVGGGGEVVGDEKGKIFI